ncbi:GNAT family N-acetyltransferase [Candidatus Peregrinibacteria bacterium]|nr:GNAT family N-acetyltransferase [Candidatus Peregrinibacteria bacterium]
MEGDKQPYAGPDGILVQVIRLRDMKNNMFCSQKKIYIGVAIRLRPRKADFAGQVSLRRYNEKYGHIITNTHIAESHDLFIIGVSPQAKNDRFTMGREASFARMQLMTPSVEYIESYRKALEEFEREGTEGFWTSLEPPDNPEAFVQYILDLREGKGLREGWVPASIYWLVDGGKFIGHVSIRHRLNKRLREFGGHIGYAIRPSKQQKGYGSSILEMAIPKARELGIGRVLVTCDPDNIASRKIIEKNGGSLMEQGTADGKPILRFWIQL